MVDSNQLTSEERPQYKAYAITDKNSKSEDRLRIEDSNDIRSEFHHDKDRIIHSRAFRRLEGKTQVVLTNESYHSRTRLTHSLEVAQMSESIAISLGLNPFATRAIALGHDIGHTPFGHTGEKALNDILL
jgi:dGTPase